MEFIKSSQQVIIKVGKNTKTYPLISSPLPHIVVESNKELHGWWEGVSPYGRRECTAERLLINPYNGCSHNCFYCYAHSYFGYLEFFYQTGIITVFSDFDKVVAQQLDSLNVASCGYLSPVTDPFQPINARYHLSEKIIKEFISRGLPIEFITKAVIPEEAIELIANHPHSFAQVSILTLNEDLRKILQKGADTSQLLDNFVRLKKRDIYTVARIDPIFPYLTDNRHDLESLIKSLAEIGVNHIVSSCVDIPIKLEKGFYHNLSRIDKDLVRRYKLLFTERIGYFLNAKLSYRLRLFQTLKELTKKHHLTFSLCMEYKRTNKRINNRYVVEGLNKEFSTSLNCEGLDVPLYKRSGDKFIPVVGCKGACLTCSRPVCGIPDLVGGGAWKLRDYKRFGKYLIHPELFLPSQEVYS